MRLDDLAAPPPRPRFREELWERADERQRVVARRWRVAAIVATAAAVAATASAGVLAFGTGGGAAVAAKTFDQTRSCPVGVQGGIPVARLHAHATYRFTSNGKTFTIPAYASFQDPGGASLGGVGQAKHGYGFSYDICKQAPRIPLARSGLPFYGVFKTGDAGFGSLDNGARCWVGTRVTVRVHAVIGANDTPTSGAVAMRTGKRKLRPMAYIQWTPKRVAVWMSPDCYPS
ncbi:MAG TPA: hypothetical protein VFI10_01180 [Gaiellaceae bacterium]|jgi:hypothetical protein|nr:hypothetical protein [Gaiellaceae bacterium]